MATENETQPKNFLKFLFVALCFVFFYLYYFFGDKEVFRAEFLAATAKIPSIRNYGGTSVVDTIKFFSAYGAYIGIGLGLLAWLVSLLLLGLTKLVRLIKFRLISTIILLAVYGAYFALAFELLNYEKRYAVWSLGIIFFMGNPLYSAALATVILIILIYFIHIIKVIFKKKQISSPT